MNTHDVDKELPPLPPMRIMTGEYRASDMYEYARAAIEPYQQRIEELEAQLEAIGAGGVSGQPITSQRGGEPVAFAKDGNLFWRGDPVAWREFSGGLYLAPQPAEPRLDAPAQVGPVRFGIGVKWSNVIRAAQRHHEYMRQPEQEQARMKKFGEAIKAIQPADPVKVPSDDIDIEDVRQYLDSWGCLAHPGVRALLARYGNAAQHDRYKSAYDEWQDKTQFIQDLINESKLPAKYLGWHRADVMRDLIERHGKAAQPSVPDAVYLGCARMGLAGASDEEVLRYARMSTKPINTAKPDPEPTPEEEERWQELEREHLVDPDKKTGIYDLQVQIHAKARSLIEDAKRAGMLVRIDLVPKRPLAMGNLEMVIDVRPARRAP